MIWLLKNIVPKLLTQTPDPNCSSRCGLVNLLKLKWLYVVHYQSRLLENTKLVKELPLRVKAEGMKEKMIKFPNPINYPCYKSWKWLIMMRIFQKEGIFYSKGIVSIKLIMHYLKSILSLFQRGTEIAAETRIDMWIPNMNLENQRGWK